MKHFIEDNVYYIVDDNKIILSITLEKMPGNQITIKTNKEVYSGPIDLISFKENNLC